MVETALMLPLLLMVIFNAVNFGYFFLVALNVAAAPRSGVEYSILGSASPAAQLLPVTGPPTTNLTVSYLVYQDMKGALHTPNSATVKVCTKANINPTTGLGVNGTGLNTKANCVTCTSGTSACGSVTPDTTIGADPEAPSFILHRVDVTYTFNPIIPGTPFGLTLLPTSICSSSGGSITCTFHRQVSMRVLD
jgi:Flp pilus assembly protein TadG